MKYITLAIRLVVMFLTYIYLHTFGRVTGFIFNKKTKKKFRRWMKNARRKTGANL